MWESIGKDITSPVQLFPRECTSLRNINKTFFILIPKKKNPQSVNDFKTISLCNVCYKIISKVLANRIKTILAKIIGPL